MKKKFFIITILTIVCIGILTFVGFLLYYSDKVTYYYEIENDEATILYASNWIFETELYIPKTITEDGIEYPVTKIAEYAFTTIPADYNVEKIIIPNTVRIIGDSAFINGNIEAVEFEKGSQLEEIHDEAFRNCTTLSTIVLPNTLKYVGRDVFTGTSLKGKEYAGGKYIGSDENEYMLLLTYNPSLVQSIHPNTMFFNNLSVLAASSENYKEDKGIIYLVNEENKKIGIVGISDEYRDVYINNIERIEIPDGVKYIFDEAFCGLTKLKTIELPNSLISIGEGAFGICKSLESVKFNDRLKRIDFRAFAGCTKLEKVELPNSVVSLRSEAFSHCTALKEIKLPKHLSYISSGLFDNCVNLETVNIENNILYIDSYAFNNCTNLKELKISFSVIKFGNLPFENCTNLTLHIENKKYMEIDAYFDWTVGLKEVVVGKEPSKVKDYSVNGKEQYQ